MPQDRPSDPDARDAADAADAAAASTPGAPLSWKTNLALFLMTTVSVFLAGTAFIPIKEDATPLERLRTLPHAWTFAVPFLCILLAHEFGHYFAARAHRVEASLPYFIPMPMLSLLGTMGAVISMKGRIRSRSALLDIGASGPLAGLVVAIPVLVIGLKHSEVAASTGPALQEGRSLLYLLLKRVVFGPIPAGHDVFLGPTAMAGWGGLLITSLNLFPVAQLDGGHIAYALLGKRQDRVGRVVHLSMIALFLGNIAYFLPPALADGSREAIDAAFGNSLSWLVWFGVVALMMRVGGREHPPTEPGELSPLRKAIAIVSLLLFVLLLMPTPFGVY